MRWGDTGPWQEVEPRRHKPLTNDELLELLNQHIPADDLPLVQLKLAELIQKARAPKTTYEPARGPGRPPGGLGFEMHKLMTGPLNSIKRRLEIGSLSNTASVIGAKTLA